MKRIVCEHCGKLLREAPDEESRGTTAARIRRAGYISKLPFLWGVTDGFHFFCSKECWKAWFKTHCKDNPEGHEVLRKLREDEPKIIKDITDGLARIAQGFSEYKKLLEERRKGH